MCLSALQLARVSLIVYGAKDYRLGAIQSWVRTCVEIFSEAIFIPFCIVSADRPKASISSNKLYWWNT